jgi:hypothetical protein
MPITPDAGLSRNRTCAGTAAGANNVAATISGVAPTARSRPNSRRRWLTENANVEAITNTHTNAASPHRNAERSTDDHAPLAHRRSPGDHVIGAERGTGPAVSLVDTVDRTPGAYRLRVERAVRYRGGHAGQSREPRRQRRGVSRRPRHRFAGQHDRSKVAIRAAIDSAVPSSSRSTPPKAPSPDHGIYTRAEPRVRLLSLLPTRGPC